MPSIDDYAEKTRQTVTAWKKMNGLQGGDPAKLAKALITLAGQRRAPAALARRRRRRRDLREEGQGVGCPGQCPPGAVLVARARRRQHLESMRKSSTCVGEAPRDEFQPNNFLIF